MSVDLVGAFVGWVVSLVGDAAIRWARRSPSERSLSKAIELTIDKVIQQTDSSSRELLREGLRECFAAPPRLMLDASTSVGEGLRTAVAAQMAALDQMIHNDTGQPFYEAVAVDRVWLVEQVTAAILVALRQVVAAGGLTELVQGVDTADVLDRLDKLGVQISGWTASAAAVATRTLLRDVRSFVGREKELGEITAAVTAAVEAGGALAIYTIHGMPGVGKTTLAVHVGHLVAERFPDRQLFLDLHAHTAGQQPMTPEAALASLLAADGLDIRHLPDGLDERAALWRDRMAHKRILLILDDAASSDQVIPLLPESAECLVLITSRRHLGDLSAVPVPLNVLPPEEAAQMFLRLASRAADESGQVAELTTLCGYLPLAISLLAKLFSQRQSWTLDHLIRETKATLLTVTAENRTIAAAFDLSYRYLPTDRRHFFRHLGLHPGVDIDTYAAAALTGLSLDQASKHLDALYRDHLLNEPVYRRFRMHDLTRDYVRELTETDPAGERDQALGRLIDYYWHTAAFADAYLTGYTRPVAAIPDIPPIAIPKLVNRDQALAWLRTERANILACLGQATRHARVVGLTAGLASLLRSDGPWLRAIELHVQAADVARHLGDRLGEANALTDLGDVRVLTDDYPGATHVLEQARGLYREVGHRLGEANALHILGVVGLVTGAYSGATQVLEQALSFYRELGNRQGEANALADLGAARWLTGNYLSADRVLEQALGLYREIGNRLGEANALLDLASVRRETRDYSGAAQVLEQALGLYREIGNRLGEANALTYLGGVRWQTGDYSGAAQVLEQALGLYREVGNRLGEANALTELGAARREAGDYSGAAQLLEKAVYLQRALGHRQGEVTALNYLGAARREVGDYSGAARVLEQALALHSKLGNRLGEAEVHNQSGILFLESGDSSQALLHHQHALDLVREVDSPLEQARALQGLGRCALDRGDTAAAVTDLRQALDIYQRIGAAEAAQLASDLANLDAG